MCGISFKVSRSDINQTKNYYSTYENHLKGCYNNYTAFVINKTYLRKSFKRVLQQLYGFRYK